MPAIVAFILLILLVPIVKAQSVQDYYQKYIQSGTSYRTSFAAYTKAKKEQIQYQTGVTQLEAIRKTNDVLLKRNDWQIDYFRYIKSVLAEATNVANYAQTIVYLDLDNEISYLDNSKSSLGSGGSFSEINAKSKEWESRATKDVSLTQAATAQISSAKLSALITQTEDIFVLYQSEIPSPSEKQTTTINLINQEISLSKKLLDDANKGLGNYKSNFSAGSTFTILRSSRDSLLNAARLMKELKGQS
jgi:hypothetical protein